MSECQFGWELLNELIPVLRSLGERVDFRLGYIGTGKGGNLQAVRGAGELLGDKLQLCALDVGGRAKWLDFLACQGEQHETIPSGWQACAARAELNEGALGACAFGTHGDQVLTAALAESEGKAIANSPTLFINGQKYAGGRSRSFLSKAICAQLPGELPSYCHDVPAPARVDVVLLTDKRCSLPGCGTERIRELLTYTLANARVRQVDWSAPEAKALFKSAKATQVPLLLFGSTLDGDAWALAHLRTALRRTDHDDYPLGIEFPSGWTPDHPPTVDARANTTGTPHLPAGAPAHSPF